INSGPIPQIYQYVDILVAPSMMHREIFEYVNEINILFNQEWCQVATPIYWRAPFSYTKERSKLALNIYRLFLSTLQRRMQP
ncbi:8607_t:CDS:1, partial [Gigaspora rosea]